jgi:tetratricopeptide (TPR) repeat protein
VRVGIAFLGAWLAVGPPARAGIYISAEVRPNEFRLTSIRLLRGTLQSLALPPRPDDSERAKYLELLRALEAQEKAGTLSELGRADLGGIYLRFGQPREAARVLSVGDGRQFLVLCNLAVANHELAVVDQNVNRLQEAILTQKDALRRWPPVWSGWTDEQAYLYRRAEILQLRLLEVRFEEMRRGDGRTQAWQAVDDLFPGFKLVDRNGVYLAGRGARPASDALAPDAPWLVRELMMAYPTDARLYWLFGEILNTAGRVEDAFQVFDNLVNANQLSNIPELMDHRRVLRERVSLLQDLRETPLFQLDGQKGLSPLTEEYLLWVAAPRSPMAVPIAGQAAVQSGWWAEIAAMAELQRQERFGRQLVPPDLPIESVAEQATMSDRAAALPDTRTLAVGFGAGFVTAVVVGLQVYVWKRRRQGVLSRRQPVG